MTQVGQTWFPVITRKGQPVLFNSYVLTGFQDQYYQEVLLLPRGIHYLKYIEGLVVLEANDADIFGRQLAEHLTAEYLSFFTAKCRQESDLLLNTAREIRSRAPYDSLSDPELTMLFTTYSSAVIRVMTFLTTIVVLETVLQSELEKKLAAHCQENNLGSDPKAYLNSLIFPDQKNIPSQALVQLYELGANVNSDPGLRLLFDADPADGLSLLRERFPTFADEFENYLVKYDFMNMEYYVGDPLRAEELWERIKEVTRTAESRLHRVEQDNRDTEKAFAEATKALKLASELRMLVTSAKQIHYLRQHRADALFKAGRDVLELLNIICRRLSIDYNDLLSLTHGEIAHSIVKSELSLDRRVMRARQERYGILWIDQEQSIITGDAVGRELEALTPTAVEVGRELRGDIAFAGRYRGRVAIVTNHSEIDKVRPGDVLVSPMTDPYFVPAMVRAGAIVTDEGGILSHAAIVSRELGIPCVVGTKNATTVLRDGVTVEVDATAATGVVRIVKE